MPLVYPDDNLAQTIPLLYVILILIILLSPLLPLPLLPLLLLGHAKLDKRQRKIREKEKKREARQVVKDRKNEEIRAKEMLDLAIYRRLKGET